MSRCVDSTGRLKCIRIHEPELCAIIIPHHQPQLFALAIRVPAVRGGSGRRAEHLFMIAANAQRAHHASAYRACASIARSSAMVWARKRSSMAVAVLAATVRGRGGGAFGGAFGEAACGERKRISLATVSSFF